MRNPTRRIAMLASAAGATVALGIGGFAYAANNDPATPEQGYAVVEDAPGTTETDGRDCPDKGQQQGDDAQTPSADPQGQA